MSLLHLALVGNPNCGKTTLFNYLTGLDRRVGNWAGVTVEQQVGTLILQDKTYQVSDLPGLYSLSSMATQSVDEQVTTTFLEEQRPDVIINVVDATHLERQLYLTLQLRTLGLPMLVVLNRMDLVEGQGLTIDSAMLSECLQCPVIMASAQSSQFLNALQEALTQALSQVEPLTWSAFSPKIQQQIQRLADCFPERPDRLSLAERLIEGSPVLSLPLSEEATQVLTEIQGALKADTGWEPEVVLATDRYSTIEAWLPKIQSRQGAPVLTDRIDSIVLHRFWGIPVFLAVMYGMFAFAITVGGIFEPFFDALSSAIFIEGMAQLLSAWQTPPWIIALIAGGVGTGLNTTITFIPVLGAMFFILSFLEDCGYMTRAALVMDRAMRWIGLPGKSFVPLVIGFGCNVPAIMASRTLETRRDRILTVMMSPFMSCGARLAIFAIFVSAFFSKGGSFIVFLLYLIGILMAISTGFLLKNTLLGGDPSPLILEIPLYQWPKLSYLWHQTSLRLKRFIAKTAKLIVPLCVVIGTLNSISLEGRLLPEITMDQSILAKVGRSLTPIFEPMGIQEHNWPATVGLLTGVLAKEVVVGTLNALYSQGEGGIAEQFDGKAGAFAYLLFVLLYFPCVSASAAMTKEVAWRWTLFSLSWTTLLAYTTAVMYYQLASFAAHPMNSLLWVALMLGILALMIYAVKRAGSYQSHSVFPTRIVLSRKA